MYLCAVVGDLQAWQERTCGPNYSSNNLFWPIWRCDRLLSPLFLSQYSLIDSLFFDRESVNLFGIMPLLSHNTFFEYFSNLSTLA